MTQVLSKFSPIYPSCVELVHPWTDSCIRGTTGCFISTVIDAFRIYSTVYALALLSRRKIPKKKDLLNSFLGVLQSTAFLSVTSGGIMFFSCLLRNLLGRYYFLSIISFPTFFASIAAILVERQSRRLPLALYVSNVATETVWNMAAARNWVSPVPHGRVLIFSLSLAILLYQFKKGLHKSSAEQKNDFTYNILRFFIGPHEEKQYKPILESNNNQETTPRVSKKSPSTFLLVQQTLAAYQALITKVKNLGGKSSACVHLHSCTHYVLFQDFQKTFGVGLTIQVILKLLLNTKKIFRSPKVAGEVLCKRDTLNLGIALGGFSVIYKLINCLLRRATGQDNPYNALPAGFIAGGAFSYYPDTTIALYIFWKMLQLSYTIGIQKGTVPKVPYFTEFFYCFSTSILFHCGLLEPLALRNSYWKFLHTISGGRMSVINRLPIDQWGLNTSQAVDIADKRNKLFKVVRFPNGCICS